MASATSPASWRFEHGPNGVCTIWFDQPGRLHNLLDPATIDELGARLAETASEPSLRGLVIRSAKERGFCAGADLETFLSVSSAELEAFLRRGLAVIDQLASLTVPSVAVIHGACLGGGLDLALACRRRVALASAAPLQLGTPEVLRGLVPGWGSVTALSRLMGPAAALDLLITGRSIGYLSAHSLGIVDRLASLAESREANDLFEAPPAAARTWPREAWEAALKRARDEVEDQPGEHPEAQLEILKIVALDLEQGPQAARRAAVGSLVALAASEDTRASIAAFLYHEKSSSEV
jgi:3-hydroxyacyl-CoA dehydrogenase/enoyl-CoA hydratase/3-hydroxybutyryl-CoA epimerase